MKEKNIGTLFLDGRTETKSCRIRTCFNVTILTNGTYFTQPQHYPSDTLKTTQPVQSNFGLMFNKILFKKFILQKYLNLPHKKCKYIFESSQTTYNIHYFKRLLPKKMHIVDR